MEGLTVVLGSGLTSCYHDLFSKKCFKRKIGNIFEAIKINNKIEIFFVKKRRSLTYHIKKVKQSETKTTTNKHRECRRKLTASDLCHSRGFLLLNDPGPSQWILPACRTTQWTWSTNCLPDPEIDSRSLLSLPRAASCFAPLRVFHGNALVARCCNHWHSCSDSRQPS